MSTTLPHSRRSDNRIVGWGRLILACPRCKQSLSFDSEQLVCSACGLVGRVDEGILRFTLAAEDASITWYRGKGGAHFFERSREPYTMSSLDTALYHNYLAGIRPISTSAVIADVGAGDGRNTMPWLTWGFERVVATDAVFASLKRFRDRLRAEHPQLLDRVLLIECDVRQLPLVGDSVDIAFSIESLYYLNEDYAQGLAECRRILRPKGRLLVAERSWEGALVTRLLYDGVEAMLSLSQSRDMWDGSGENKVRSRCFTEEELRIVLGQGGFALLESRGSSILSLVLGYLRGEGKLRSEDESLLPDVHSLLNKLGDRGQMRRAHVMLAEKRA